MVRALVVKSTEGRLENAGLRRRPQIKFFSVLGMSVEQGSSAQSN